MLEKMKKMTLSTFLVSGSTAVFAIISLISVFISINTWQTQREASRPYFTFKESPSIELASEVSLEFRFFNVGAHPATELTSKTMVFHENLAENPILIDTYRVVNDIPRDTATSLLLHLDSNYVDANDPNLDAFYIVIRLDYWDPILKEPFFQTIFVKWPGVYQDRVQPLIHMEAGEKERVIQYIKERNLTSLN
ncbi:hypothetical protein Desdi_2000 [Desulfitobacterium dichloroeliminans LMG P-21439]|uniref:Uncharacterized protein n=1 Tax=Desulfitobacterium dichloroeliminans (strain LMG P-21439 / DCA1) TaxID=871963 RepID=L0F8T6_DESDL|nr:hypothetical protein [Desulfitobacterium dichloroeliminans]AGA69445.1 hypothetical protein Desdi_2000 [Desulfitobacterium dichloroeliminans LMG P-21439]